MITNHHPQDYSRPIDLTPRPVRMCWHCGGVCAELPELGVACIKCHGTTWLTVLDCDLQAWRDRLAQFRDTADAITPRLPMEDASVLLKLINGIAVPDDSGS